MTTAREDDCLLRLSLVAVWLFTAVASIMELDGQSSRVLAEAGVASPLWLVRCLIIGGAAADLVIGLALWWRPGRISYFSALALLLVMTAVATFLQPSL